MFRKKTHSEDELEVQKKRYMSPENGNKLLMNLGYYNNIIMEYKNIANLLGNASNQPSRFRTKNGLK